MKRAPALLAVGLLSAGLSGCGAGEPERTAAKAGKPSPVTTATPAVVAEGALGGPTTVPGQANIFGAGREQPPAPGGGGPGVLPARWRLPAGTHRVIRFPSPTGRVSPINVADANGAAGDREGPTDVTSYRGISGIVHRRNGMFLVGVFLTDDAPAKAAPERLNFTKRERFKSVAPRIGQTFLVGDGKRRSYHVPARATRLYLGFADGYLYAGHPGWYGNNAGELSVTVKMAGAR